MISFLKTCLRGFLTVILSPLWLLFFVLYIIYSIILFIYTGIKNLINMILHRSHKIYDTDYDKRAAEILQNASIGIGPQMQAPVYQQPIFGSYQQQPIQPPVYPQQNYPQQMQNQYPQQQYPQYNQASPQQGQYMQPPFYNNNGNNGEDQR